MSPPFLQRLNARWERLRGAPGSRARRISLGVEVVIVGLVGCWLGLLAGGRLDAPVGPLETRLSVSPSVHGGSEVAIPPLGELVVDSHAAPWRLTAEVTRINAADARRIFSNPAAVNGLGDQVTEDLTEAVRTVALRSLVAGVIGALLLGLMVFRRRLRLVLASGGVSLAVLLAGGGVAAATWNPKAINQPEFHGLLASAPTVVGDARSIVRDFQRYEAQLAKLVTNVSRLYDVTSALPAYRPDPATIRVLFVSDLHINPASWDVIRSISQQFNVDLIVDAGDISDHGTAAENAYLEPIGTLGVPYVWVRGNHDSNITQAGVAAQPNAVVLDGQTEVVAGLRFVGAGDPRFTPDKDTRDEVAPPSVSQVGLAIASTARQSAAEGEPVDIAVVHDGEAATEIDGTAPLVLSGHYHRREQNLLPRGSLSFFQGSTGASGLRGLEKEKPTPVRASVLYFDRETRSLQAWDDITLGGLGLVSAKIERRIYAEQFPPEDRPTPSPTGVTPSPTGVSPTAQAR
ncbi:MAG: metallophosphoesterase family protein [Actinomycetes bacterium]